MQESPLGLNFILYFAKGQEGILYTGLIAQDVEKVCQELGSDFSGLDKPKNDNNYYQLRYATFVVPLIKATQELNAENEKLKMKNEELESRLKRLEEMVEVKP